MFRLPINVEFINDRIDKITSDYEWEAAEEEIFKISQWPESSLENLEEDEKKGPLMIERCLWYPYIKSYDVDPLLAYYYALFSQCVFEKLYPEAHKENMNINNANGARKCAFCSIWTRSKSLKICPKCDRELLYFPLNE